MYIADQNNYRVRKVTVSTGIITTIAGSSSSGYSGDGGEAIAARLNKPIGVALDTSNHVYIADYYNNRVRKVTLAGTWGPTVVPTAIPTIIPTSPPTFVPTNTSSIDPTISPTDTPSIIPTVTPTYYPTFSPSVDVITTFAGTGTGAYSGDNGQASAADIFQPFGVALDSSG